MEKKALVKSCLAMLLCLVFCRVRVFPAFGTPGRGDHYCVRPDEMGMGQGRGQGRAWLARRTRVLSQRLRHPGMGEKCWMDC